VAILTCRTKPLAEQQLQLAAQRSIEINPANATDSRTVERTPVGRRGGPRRLALLVGNRWPAAGMTLTVYFLDTPSKELRKKILLHMNAWNESCSITFVETGRDAMVRVARFDQPADMAGYWSYVGTQILGIGAGEPTLNLEGFTMRTPETEFRRVVRHEAGHTLGFEHEHMRSELVKRIDRRKAIAYFDQTQGWTVQETIDQVLTPLAARSIMGTTESDPVSIMCYEIPGAITKDGKPIRGGVDINPNDFQFAAKVYPKRPAQGHAATPPPTPGVAASVHPHAVAGPPESDTLHIVIMDEFDPVKGVPTNSKNPRFARVLATYAGARVTGTMRLRAEGGEAPTSFAKIIGMHERIKNYANHDKGTLPNDKELLQFGSDLFEAMFQGDVRRLYDEARSRQQNRKLDIVLTSMIPWIAEKPWEFAYDAGRESFLATEEIHLVRNVLTSVPASAITPKPGPLRILVVAAQPVGLGQLSVDEEIEVIRRGFGPLEDEGLVSVEVLPRATPRRLQACLSTGSFTVVHIIGHSAFDETTEEGVLFFEDEQGGQLRLGQRSVREIFCKRGVTLVFLNSCESGSGGRHNFNRGVAQAMVSHGLPAVVANQYSVLDLSATSFAQHFYWSIANGMSIGQAACEARIAINCSLEGEIIDWAVPVVYVRDPNMTICAKPDRVVSPVGAVRGSARHALRDRPVRVAVWDIDNMFPSLSHTLERMNLTQLTFGFELAALSVPIDAWDVDQRADDDTPYLWAEKLAGRLKDITVELRVNVLACITRHWMRDDEVRNLYSWWPAKKKPPVIIFSCAGFDQMTPSGPDTERAIANVTVTGLAGFFGDLNSHKRGAKDCPLAFNLERDFARLTGRQKFDPNCRAKLKAKIPQEYFAALEALLEPLP
jgi:hypothetical protein